MQIAWKAVVPGVYEGLAELCGSRDYAVFLTIVKKCYERHFACL
jgi:hypothetical protein